MPKNYRSHSSNGPKSSTKSSSKSSGQGKKSKFPTPKITFNEVRDLVDNMTHLECQIFAEVHKNGGDTTPNEDAWFTATFGEGDRSPHLHPFMVVALLKINKLLCDSEITEQDFVARFEESFEEVGREIFRQRVTKNTDNFASVSSRILLVPKQTDGKGLARFRLVETPPNSLLLELISEIAIRCHALIDLLSYVGQCRNVTDLPEEGKKLLDMVLKRADESTSGKN